MEQVSSVQWTNRGVAALAGRLFRAATKVGEFGLLTVRAVRDERRSAMHAMSAVVISGLFALLTPLTVVAQPAAEKFDRGGIG
ncbi:MAG: hypothetical protein ACR2P6_07190, partial [Gammaproteobacteria bacterium]